MSATLTIDWSRCKGHGVCLAAFGERLTPDRWGYPKGIPTAGASLDESELGAARAAVATCPVSALGLRIE